MRRLLPLFLAACFPECALQAQESRPETTSRPSGHDLRLSDVPRARIVELRQGVKGKLTLKKDDGEITLPMESSSQARWLDELSEAKSKRTDNRRTFIEARRTFNNRTQDPGFEGLTVVVVMEGSDKSSADAAPPRRALKREMSKQLAQRGAMGLWVPLPANAEVGASFAFRGQPMIATLVDYDGEISAFEATLTLDRVDPKTNRAHLTGNALFSEALDENGMTLTVAYSAALTLDVDLAAHELVKATVKGQATFAGRGEYQGRVSGGLAFDGEATGRPATDVAAIKSRKAVFRENQHGVGAIEFRLPSCWVRVAEGKDAASFSDSRLESELGVEVARIGMDVDPQSNDFIAGMLASLQKIDPDAKLGKASFPSGKGLNFELKKDDGTPIRGSVVPLGRVLIRVRLVGPADAMKKVDGEMRALINSLKTATG